MPLTIQELNQRCLGLGPNTQLVFLTPGGITIPLKLEVIGLSQPEETPKIALSLDGQAGTEPSIPLPEEALPDLDGDGTPGDQFSDLDDASLDEDEE